MMGGDIWSTGAFSFESPLKDLLDSNDYTLEQLLAEDELLQELRGCHEQLIRYFATEEAVTKLVKYIVMPPGRKIENGAIERFNEEEKKAEDNKDKDTSEGDNKDDPVMNGEASTPEKKEPGAWLQGQSPESIKSDSDKHPERDPDMLYIRFPYMACEIICCELNIVIDTLVCGKQKEEGNEDQSDDEREENAPEQTTTEIVTTSDSDDVELVQSTTVSTVCDSETGEMVQQAAQVDYSNSILDLLFSLLRNTEQGDLDDYRAGYFDKILTVLFRKRPDEVTAYINCGGGRGSYSLMQAMLKHLYSHSIMQIAQRLLLPQRPSGKLQNDGLDGVEGEDDDGMVKTDGMGGDEIIPGEDPEPKVHCNWSDTSEALDLLLDILIGTDPSSSSTSPILSPTFEEREEQRLDLSLNASEVLITIIQNSMLSSSIMLSLTETQTIERIVRAATTLPPPKEGEKEYFSPHESLLTSAMNVLESLILQLGGYGAVGTMSLLPDGCEDDPNNQIDLSDPQNTNVFSSDSADESGDQPQQSQEGIDKCENDNNFADGEIENDKHLIADLGTMLEHLPVMLNNLSYLLRHPSTETWKSPMQYSDSEPQQMLGNSRLRIVRVLESLVLLGDPDVDAILVQSDCLELCLEFFWEFQWCSMLHQSVANLLVHVFEGQNTRYEMQEFFLNRCNLLGRLMDSFLEEAHPLQAPQVSFSQNDIDGAVMVNSAKIEDVVENLKDLNMSDVQSGEAAASSVESDKGGDSDPLPVSEDDVEAAMERESNNATNMDFMITNQEQVSTEAVRYESRDASTVGGGINPPQSFRFGYMGHVIIICQALVNAYMNDPDQQEPPDESTAQNREQQDTYGGFIRKENTEGAEEEYTGPKDDLGDPLLLAELVSSHPLADRWHEFVATTLASENAIQSTQLGGFVMQGPSSHSGMDPMHSHRPGLADEGYMMGDDGEGPPAPPRGMLGGGDVIDMDDNDLEIAANMMAGLTLTTNRPTHGIGPPGNNLDDSDDGDDGDGSSGGDSNRSYNSGETASDRSGYAFDDPLGKAGGLGIALGELTQYEEPKKDKRRHSKHKKPKPPDEPEDDNNSHSSSSEEEQDDEDDDDDAPVMDLFAGNFNDNENGSPGSSDEQPEVVDDFADFASFEQPALDGETAADDEFGAFTSAGEPDNSDFGAFESAEPASSDFGAFESSNTEKDAFEIEPMKSSEFEEIFGKGDHASLLEEDDDDPFAIGASASGKPTEIAVSSEDDEPTELTMGDPADTSEVKSKDDAVVSVTVNEAEENRPATPDDIVKVGKDEVGGVSAEGIESPNEKEAVSVTSGES